jgi:hypothetical protein
MFFTVSIFGWNCLKYPEIVVIQGIEILANKTEEKTLIEQFKKHLLAVFQYFFGKKKCVYG